MDDPELSQELVRSVGIPLGENHYQVWRRVLSLAWPVLVQQYLILSVQLSDRYLAGNRLSIGANQCSVSRLDAGLFYHACKCRHHRSRRPVCRGRRPLPCHQSDKPINSLGGGLRNWHEHRRAFHCRHFDRTSTTQRPDRQFRSGVLAAAINALPLSDDRSGRNRLPGRRR